MFTFTNQKSLRRNAFTLIEILVVVAILAILAAILFPVFARSRENARRSSCQSNLKQIGLGVLQYTQDFDEHYPPFHNHVFTSVPSGGERNWAQMIYPYVKSTQLFKCPSNSATYNIGEGGNDPVQIPASYAANPRIIAVDAAVVPVSLSYLDSASKKILLTETAGGYPGAGWPDWTSASKWGELAGSNFKGHLGTGNYLFADGHVKALKPIATMTPFNMWGSFYDSSGGGNDVCYQWGNNPNCDVPSNGATAGVAALGEYAWN